MHCHCGTNNRAPRWTFTDPCKPEVRPGAREESASPAWLAAPAMNARDTTKVYIWRFVIGCGPTLGSVTATTHQEKGMITLESNPSRGTVLPAPRGKGNKWQKCKIQRNWCTVTVAQGSTSHCMTRAPYRHKTSSMTISSVPWRISAREACLKVALPSE